LAEMPEIGEIVVCRVKKVLDYGVFVDLLEYNDLQGFVHISQVSSSWIKNIRNFVKENQIRAAKVSRIDPSKDQIDLSLNKVSAGAQRRKIEEFKQLKRIQKLLELVAKKTKSDSEKAWDEITTPLMEKYDSLYKGLQEILIKGDDVLNLVPSKYRKELKEVVEKNIELPKKTVKGTLKISSGASDGMEKVKKALVEAKNAGKKGNAEIIYVGSGCYGLSVSAPDYKSAEKILKLVTDKAIQSIEAVGGKGEFTKND
jgi:translation initiation factor 2 subunit 1